MLATLVRLAVPLLLVLTLGAVSVAGDLSGPQVSPAPSLVGTYRLVSRQLPDGTVLRPPEVIGLFTYTKTHRTFHILQKGATGQWASFSVVSTDTLTPAAYTETLLYSVRTDLAGGKDPVYDVFGETRSAPVTMDGGRLQFKAPFDPPVFVFEGKTLTVTRDGRVDVWEKVD